MAHPTAHQSTQVTNQTKRVFWFRAFFFFSSVLGVACASAQAVPPSPVNPQVQAIIKQGPGMLPPVTLVRDHLIIAYGVDKQTYLYKISPNDGSLAPRVTLPGFIGSFSATSDEATGWVSTCYSMGQDMVNFKLDELPTLTNYHFSEEYSSSCAGLAFERTSSGENRLWIGSTQDRTLLLVDPKNPSTVYDKIEMISGPFAIVKAGNYLFGINGLIAADKALPFVIDTRTKQVVAGNGLGDQDKTTFKREYAQFVFNDENATGKVYFANPRKHEIMGLSVASPSETQTTITKVSVTNPRNIARFGTCLVVLGTSADEWRFPQWSVLKKNSQTGTLEEVFYTDYFQHKGINGGIREVIDSFGNIYMPHWKGVVRLSGVFDSVDCKN